VRIEVPFERSYFINGPESGSLQRLAVAVVADEVPVLMAHVGGGASKSGPDLGCSHGEGTATKARSALATEGYSSNKWLEHNPA